jgi:hypothetical protein
MKPIVWMGVLLAGALSGGCLPTSFVAPDKTASGPVEPARPTVRPPVLAGQIDSTNAREKAQALREELDRDMPHAGDAGDPKSSK